MDRSVFMRKAQRAVMTASRRPYGPGCVAPFRRKVHAWAGYIEAVGRFVAPRWPGSQPFPAWRVNRAGPE